MNRQLPWDRIAVPEADFNVLRLDADSTVPTFYGRNSNGRYLFIVQLEGDLPSELTSQRPVLRGVEVDLRQKEGEATHRLILTLQSIEDADLFSVLCNSLHSVLASAIGGERALSLSLIHLRRWKSFFAGTGPRLLSPEQVRGLFAELHFLQSLLASGRRAEFPTMESWTGPDELQQDFVFSDCAVEVKSVRPADPSTVRISSELQLQSSQPHLYLVLFYLVEDDSATGISLNDLVASLGEALTSEEASQLLYSKLSQVGYLPVTDYDLPKFTLSETRSYEVVPGFPRIIRAEIDPGIVRVKYQIEIEHLTPFQCPNENTIGT